MSERHLYNVNIVSQELLPTPQALCSRYPASAAAEETVFGAREQIKRILRGEDARVMVVVGPCSIHDIDAAVEYGARLAALSHELSDTLLLVMRVYFEKPRTSTGWKGLINDPRLDDSFHIEEGLDKARSLLLRLAEMRVPVGTEALDPITPQYLSDLVSWYAIGARTSESQTHRDMASGLSAPVGFKNGTDGNIDAAINALTAVSRPQHFLGVTSDGRCAVFHTGGNPNSHVILRGGARPNYDSVSVAMCEQALTAAGLPCNVVIDCSHGNSFKKHDMQPLVLKNCINQIRDGNRSIVGFMLESNLEAGRQDIPADRSKLARGVSVTDACIDWRTTEAALREARELLAPALERRKSKR
jgi:3-deoxy-7-phosphoheptulonate synthase